MQSASFSLSGLHTMTKSSTDSVTLSVTSKESGLNARVTSRTETHPRGNPARRVLGTNIREPEKSTSPSFQSDLKQISRDWLGDWKDALKFKTFGGDLIAGLTVAAVALPLNLALAVASGLSPSAGLVAGAIGGGIAAIFGGAKLQVTGPAAALSTMVFALGERFSLTGVMAACLIIGVVQILLGLFRTGKLARHVPESVLAGFTSGVGLKLLDNQIPELLGFNYKVFELAQMMHRPAWLHEVSWIAVVCGLFVAFLVIVTKHWTKFPGALVGISIVTALSVYLGWDISRVDAIPSSFPPPALPLIPDHLWLDLLVATIPLAILAAAESLLSAQVVDRMVHAKNPHNPNLELLGQGLANLGSGLFGGMPVTGVVVRSSVNLQSGGKSRLSALTHALILFFSVIFLSTTLAKIPLAGLAGLLCVIGFRLLDFKTISHLIQEEKPEAIAFLVTMAGTVSGYLVQGLAAGLMIHFAWRFVHRDRHREEAEQAKMKESGIRAVLSREKSGARRPGHYEPSPESNNWLMQIRERAHMAASSFVHNQASVIGRVVLGDHVHIAAGSSVRADEGTPFFIGSNTNVQDGVVLHALKDRWVSVAGEQWAIYVGENVSMAHHALVHGPCFIGDNSFIGFKAVVHDSIVGSHCYIGIGAVVVGVEIPDGRYVPHGAVVDTADKVDALPRVTDAHKHFNEDVVEVNRGLAAAYRANDIGNGFALGAMPTPITVPVTAAVQDKSRDWDRF